MANQNENDPILQELRKLNHLLTMMLIDGKNDYEKIGFLSDLKLSSSEIAKYVNMHPGNIRKVAAKWKQSKGK